LNPINHTSNPLNQTVEDVFEKNDFGLKLTRLNRTYLSQFRPTCYKYPQTQNTKYLWILGRHSGAHDSYFTLSNQVEQPSTTS